MKIVKNAAVLSLVVGAAAVAADANALGVVQTAGSPITAYVKFTGRNGTFKGSVTQKGREGASLVLGVDYDTSAPRDPSSGLATAKRQHSPFTIIKELDSSSPQLYNAIATNEVLKNVEIDFVQSGQTLFKYVLTNAVLADVHHSLTTPCVAGSPCKATGPDGNIVGPDAPTESLSLTFQKIEISWVDGGVTASDDWTAPAE